MTQNLTLFISVFYHQLIMCTDIFKYSKTIKQVNLPTRLKEGNPVHWIILIHTLCQIQSSVSDEEKGKPKSRNAFLNSSSIHNHDRHHEILKDGLG